MSEPAYTEPNPPPFETVLPWVDYLELTLALRRSRLLDVPNNDYSENYQTSVRDREDQITFKYRDAVIGWMCPCNQHGRPVDLVPLSGELDHADVRYVGVVANHKLGALDQPSNAAYNNTISFLQAARFSTPPMLLGSEAAEWAACDLMSYHIMQWRQDCYLRRVSTTKLLIDAREALNRHDFGHCLGGM